MSNEIVKTYQFSSTMQYGLLRSEGREAVQWGNSETTAFSQLLASLRTDHATSVFVPKDMSKRQVGVFCVHWKPYFKYMIWKKAFVVVCPYMYAFVCVSILPIPSFRSRSSYILDSLVSQFGLKNSIELSSFLFLTISFEWSI